MKVGLNISPTKNIHRFRGIGFYTQNLVDCLKAQKSKDFEIIFFDGEEVPKGIDLVHYPYFDLFKPTLKIGNQKTVVTVHDVIPLLFSSHYPPGLRGRVNFWLQKRSLLASSSVICDSRASKRDIAKHLNYPKKKIHVVYLAANKIYKPVKSESMLRAVKKKYHLPKKFVLYVGDVNYHKNLLGLIAAVKKTDLPLVIAGKAATAKTFDSSHIENQPLVKIIKEFGDDPKVRRLGFVPDKELVVLYNLASVYCLPSFYEGFGLSILEAMACGTPVVAAKTGSLPEVCGQAAVMVNPRKVDQMAKQLSKVALDSKLSKKLSDEGISQAKKFKWQKTAEQTLEVYREVFNEG